MRSNQCIPLRCLLYPWLLLQCGLFLVGCGQDSMGSKFRSGSKAQPPVGSPALQHRVVGSTTNNYLTFQLTGTPLFARIQEIRGIVFEEDFNEPPTRISHGPQVLPTVTTPSAPSADGAARALTASPAGVGMSFLTRPPYGSGSLELRLLLKLKGLSIPSSQLFFNPGSGLLLAKGSAGEMQRLREIIQDPPTNAVAYLKSLTTKSLGE